MKKPWDGNLHGILRNSNKFWRIMFYDDLIDHESYQISLLPGADRLYYNAAHALTTSNEDILIDIEKKFRTAHVQPAVYLDPAAPSNLVNVLTKHGYGLVEAEDEHWYGYDLKNASLTKNSEEFLKFKPSTFHISVFNPCEGVDLENFMSVNAKANNLPLELTMRLKTGLLRVPTGVQIYLLLAYIDGIPIATKALGLLDGVGFTAEDATLSEYRRKGIALALVAEAAKLAKKVGAAALYVNCDTDAFSNQVYQKFGYERIFTRRYYQKQALSA